MSGLCSEYLAESQRCSSSSRNRPGVSFGRPGPSPAPRPLPARMSGKTFDRLAAAGVSVVSLVVYTLTMATTAPFWDSGEFIAIANGLQVSHPPGAPFYMLVGRLFALFAPLFSAFTDEPVAMAVNFVSPVSSALTILLTHLIIVRFARVWLGHPAEWSWTDRAAATVGGVVGSLAFAFTDSFWFNAVEAEVYAMSMLFTALVVWLALVWRDATRHEEAAFRARGEHPFGLHADRYLVAIAYLFGLAIGIHLLNVLTLFFIALVVFYEKADRPEWTTGQRVRGLLVTAVVSALFFFVIYPGVVQTLPTLAGASGAPGPFLVAVLAALVGVVWWTQKNRRPVANLLSLTALVILLGYSSYGLIFVRSAADPPIDENDPETADAIVSYLKREQYGSTPLLSGLTYDARTGQISEPTSFPRRHSSQPAHVAEYARYDSDSDFFWSYQMGHMYWRYFMWQFVGKVNDTQDAGWTAGLGAQPPEPDLAPSEAASRNVYFGLPLLLGLIGMAFHVQRDWRRALAVFVLFLVTGVGIILYLNQTPFQPRERDYSYVASFFAFALWIGLGATGLVELTAEALRGRGETLRRAAATAVAVALLVAVPGLMAAQNWDDHDRSGVRIPSDFARNLLESTAPNAILFTNGDNDTFPLWYLQEVMNVRRDVRVVNLSLLNTPWYIRQLRDQASRTSAPLPMSLTDAQVDGLQPQLFTPADYTLPVDRQRFGDAGFAGRIGAADLPREMTWRLEGQPVGEGQAALYVSDLVVLDILTSVAEDGWRRPVYFASTVAQDSELSLQPFFQNEGLARRVVPVRRDTPDPDGTVVPEIALARLANFRLRGLNDPDVYLDENARNMADSYRTRFGAIATALARQGRTADARALLARLDREVSSETIPLGFGSLYTLAEAYREAGDTVRMRATLRQAEDDVFGQIARARAGGAPGELERAYQFLQFVQTGYLLGGAPEAAAALTARLATALGDPSLRQSVDEMRAAGADLRRQRDSLGAGAR